MTEQFDFSEAGNSSEPTAAFETITPEIAKEMLGLLNVRNRNLSDRSIAELARSIEDGDHLINGETIKFSWPVDRGNGLWLPILLDGQHRLEAVVKAGKPIRILVVRGLDPKTQATMDTGRKRTTADWFKINGEKETTTYGAIVAGAWKWNIGDRKFLTNPKPTPLEAWTLKQEHPELERSLQLGIETGRDFPDLKKTSLGIAHYIINGVDEVHAPYFFRLVGTGADISLGHPVRALRERASSYRRGGEPMPIRREVGLLMQAWNKCVENDEVQRIIHALDAPVPEALNPMGQYIPMLAHAKHLVRE